MAHFRISHQSVLHYWANCILQKDYIKYAFWCFTAGCCDEQWEHYWPKFKLKFILVKCTFTRHRLPANSRIDHWSLCLISWTWLMFRASFSAWCTVWAISSGADGGAYNSIQLLAVWLQSSQDAGGCCSAAGLLLQGSDYGGKGSAGSTPHPYSPCLRFQPILACL